MERDDLKAAHTNVVRAQDILVELLGSLNHEAGGQIASQLASLYDYCFRRLVIANVKKDPAPAREVVGISWPQARQPCRNRRESMRWMPRERRLGRPGL